MRTLSMVTVRAYGYLKISEMMLFAVRFVEGRYKEIYGRNVDPQQLTRCLDAFVDERNTIFAKAEQEEMERMQEEERRQKPPMTWEAFCQRNGIDRENPLGEIFKP